MSRVFDIENLMQEDTDDVSFSSARGFSRDRFQRHFVAGRFQRATSSRGGKHTTLLDKPICAIDGEGKTRPNGRHDYTLLAAMWTDGRRCISAHALTSEQCLDFLMNLPEDHVYVGYGLSYDTNMWLLGLPNAHINILLDTGEVRYRQYVIKWVERKYMTIRAYGKSRTIYDVLAFFQVPFVSPDPSIVKGACDAWLPEFASELETVRVMKDLRKTFQHVPDERIEAYTYLECDLLIKLMQKFIAALKSTDLKPSGLYGPGALAAALYKRHGIKRYMGTLPDPMPALAHVAYFGGRFDAALLGWLENCWQFDIHSAYPHILRGLACLTHAAFAYHKAGFDTLNPGREGIYHVTWSIDPESRWGPFPHRTEKGLIYYPYDGAGWYHADEVRAAIEMFGTDAIKVLEGWELIRQCDHKPFAFIDSLYALRKELESAGNRDQGVIIKLLLNSLYGKLAQQVGHRKDVPPPFQCFYWAGAITSGTRAQILRAIAMDADKVIGIATDGIVATEKLDLICGDELGEWEVKELAEYAQISNGVYHAVDTSGKHIDRARGLGRGVLDFARGGPLYRAWRASYGLGVYHYQGRERFVTHREARQRIDRNEIKCRWLAEKRTLEFAPRRRFPWPTPRNRKRDLLATRLLSFSDYTNERESQPFRLKTARGEVERLRDEHQGTSWLDSA